MSWVDEAVGWISEKLVYDETGRELDRLSGLLREGGRDERLGAVKQLTYMRAADSVSLLIGALRDKEPAVRAAAVGGLGYKASTEAVTSLSVLLGDADPAVRTRVVAALNEIGLPSSRSWIRAWREIAAAPSDDGRIAELLGRALDDADPEVRRTAVGLLPRHGRRGVGIVRAHLQRQDVTPESLDAAEPELARALSARDPEHRKAAVETLFRVYGQRAVRPLAEALSDGDPEVRQAAVDAVTSLSPRPAFDEILERLDDPDEGVVVKVIEGLVCARNLETFDEGEEAELHEQLLRLARYREGRTRAVAAWGLGQMGRVGAVGTLCELLESHDEGVLVAAAEALGKINDPRAVTPLLRLLERDVPERASAAAIGSLARSEDVRTIAVLVKRLFVETRPGLERALEEALLALCASVDPALQAQLQQPDAALRLAAVQRAVSEPRLVFALIGQLLDGPSDEVKGAAREVLSKQGYDVVDLARATLRLPDKSESRRVLAINLVVALRPDDTVALLDGLLQDPDEPAQVYRHAAAALSRVGGPAALAALKRHAEQGKPAVAEWARAALPPPSA